MKAQHGARGQKRVSGSSADPTTMSLVDDSKQRPTLTVLAGGLQLELILSRYASAKATLLGGITGRR